MNSNLKKIEPEADGVVKDGQAIRVRMSVMDAALIREVTDHFSGQLVADHHRPHHGVLTDEQRTAAVDRVKTYDAKVSSAWKNPTPLFVPPAPVAAVHDQTMSHARDLPPAAGNIAELDAIQAANQAKYNERIEAAYKGAK